MSQGAPKPDQRPTHLSTAAQKLNRKTPSRGRYSRMRRRSGRGTMKRPRGVYGVNRVARQVNPLPTRTAFAYFQGGSATAAELRPGIPGGSQKRSLFELRKRIRKRRENRVPRGPQNEPKSSQEAQKWFPEGAFEASRKEGQKKVQKTVIFGPPGTLEMRRPPRRELNLHCCKELYKISPKAFQNGAKSKLKWRQNPFKCVPRGVQKRS